MIHQQIFAIVALCLCIEIKAYDGKGWWLRQPYKEDEDFNVKREYLTSFQINCREESSMLSENISVEYWLLPDMTMLNDMNTRKEYTSIDGISATEWTAEGASLNITMLLEVQFGFYFCHGSNDDGRFVIKKAVNYQGPFFGNTWETYRLNTIIGCSSAAAFFVIAMVLYCIYEYKYDHDDPYATESPKVGYSNGSGAARTYENSGFEDGVPTKRRPIEIDTTEL